MFSGDPRRAADILGEADLYGGLCGKSDRAALCCLALLMESEGASAAGLAEALFLSRASVLSGYSDIMKRFGAAKIEVGGIISTGIRVKCTELERRRALAGLLAEIADGGGGERRLSPFLKTLRPAEGGPDCFETIRGALEVAARARGAALSESALLKAAAYLTAAAGRMAAGCYLSASEFKMGRCYALANEAVSAAAALFRDRGGR